MKNDIKAPKTQKTLEELFEEDLAQVGGGNPTGAAPAQTGGSSAASTVVALAAWRPLVLGPRTDVGH